MLDIAQENTEILLVNGESTEDREKILMVYMQ